jgi:hypothetical protein
MFDDNSNNEHYLVQNISYTAVPTTSSIYAKSASATKQLWMYEYDAGGSKGAKFDLTVGRIVSTVNATATMIPVGNETYRCTITYTPQVGLHTFYIESYDITTGSSVYLGTNSPLFYIWGVQTEALPFASSYIPNLAGGTSTRTADSMYERVQDGNTNYLLDSQRMDTANWTPVRSSVVANSTTYLAPDGTATADILHEDNTVGATHPLYQGVNLTAWHTYTMSIYVHYLGRSWFQLTDGGGDGTVYFNTYLGTVGTTGALATPHISRVSVDKIKDTQVPWYRVSTTFVSQPAHAGATQFYLMPADADGSHTFNGLDMDSLVYWGGQLEDNTIANNVVQALAYGPTVYIPTTSAAVYAPAKDRLLPDTFTPTVNSKLEIEFEAKCEWSSSVNMGSAVVRRLMTIPNTAYASASSVTIFGYNGRIYFDFNDTVPVNHRVYSGVDVVDYSNWNLYRFLIDNSDLSRMNAWINGSNSGFTYSANSGTSSASMVDHIIIVGDRLAEPAYCKFRNSRISPREW